MLLPYCFFCVLSGEALDEPDVPPAAPLAELPDPEVEPAWPGWSLELDELELGEDEDGLDELPAAELEPDGLDGVALPLEDEDELGELGVVALPDIEPELEPERFVASLDEPDEEDAPVAPRLASPPPSQP